MPVIRAGNNLVVAWEHTADDTHFRVHINGPDGGHLSPLQPIEEHAATLEWAVEMAEQMAFPIHLVPRDGVHALREPELVGGFASLTDQERGELRAFMVAQLTQIMRDSPDPSARTEAYDVLLKMKVVRE